MTARPLLPIGEGLLVIVLVSVITFLGDNCQAQTQAKTPELLQSRLDRHCADVARENLGANDKLTSVEAFYSWKINTCVAIQIEFDSNTSFYYALSDVSHGFFRGPSWVKTEIPLNVSKIESIGLVLAEGFWQSTDKSSDKQLISPIAVKIECSRDQNVCRESDATVLVGILQPSTSEFSISTWNHDGIVTDDADEGNCAIGHRLSIDFKSNSVIVTDYPKKVSGSDCKAFQNANSYALHGGQIMQFYPDQIFYCSSYGASSAILAKVSEFHGEVANKAVELWKDDGEGGLLATRDTPKHPYSRRDCERLMEKKLQELKGQ